LQKSLVDNYQTFKLVQTFMELFDFDLIFGNKETLVCDWIFVV